MVPSCPALTLVVLRSADPQQTRIFYEALGLTLVAEQHSGGPRHFSCVLGGVVLEIYPRGEHDTRGLRLGISVTDVPARVDAIRRAGGRVLRFDPSATGRSALVVDPDGHTVELTEARDDVGVGPASTA